MLTTRRSILAGATAALLAPSGPARAMVPDNFANLMRRVMALHWRGTGTFAADWVQGNQFVSQIEIDLQVDSDWDFTGQMAESFNLDGRRYSGTSRIWGNCWVVGSKAGLSITGMRNISGDALPGNVGWSTSTGDLQFHNDSDRAGHFVLEGYLQDDTAATRTRVFLIDP
ncbi:MAG: hypothetical protein ACKOPG_05860 [Novosphingobium sp.]